MKALLVNRLNYMLFKKYSSPTSLFVLSCLIASISFRIVNLNKPFLGDEYILANISKLNFAEIFTILKEKVGYPPLSYIFLYFWGKVSQSEIWIRLYFVMFGIGVCILAYLFGREYLDKKLGRISLLLTTFSPLLIFTSQYVRSYIDSTFWMLLSSFFMLKIIKGRDRLVNWVGYIGAVTLSFYTFYFSALLVFAQFIFVTFAMRKNKKLIFKWYLSIFLAGLLFIPWLSTAIIQYNTGSSLVYDWSTKGFNFGLFRIGQYTRNIVSLVGFDPHFMVFKGGVRAHFGDSVIISGIILCFGILFFFLREHFRYLKEKFSGNKVLIWFFPSLIFIPLLVSWTCAALLNILLNAKHLVVLHVFFLMLISIFIHSLYEKKRLIGRIFIILILGVFMVRIPHAISSEFDTIKAESFLRENLGNDDCLICVSIAPAEGSLPNVIKIKKYFMLNETGSEYVVVSSKVWDELRQQIISFKSIWFYRAYGNFEIFKANHLVDNWLRNNGYNAIRKESFRNIELIEYRR